MAENQSELWNDWSPEPPIPLPENFASETLRVAVVAKNNQRALKTFQIGSCLALVLAGFIAWNLCRNDTTPQSPPALTLFHGHSAGNPGIFEQP